MEKLSTIYARLAEAHTHLEYAQDIIKNLDDTIEDQEHIINTLYDLTNSQTEKILNLEKELEEKNQKIVSLEKDNEEADLRIKDLEDFSVGMTQDRNDLLEEIRKLKSTSRDFLNQHNLRVLYENIPSLKRSIDDASDKIEKLKMMSNGLQELFEVTASLKELKYWADDLYEREKEYRNNPMGRD